MLTVRKPDIYESIPEDLYHLGVPLVVLIKLADLVDFTKAEPFTSYEKVILDQLLIILKSNDVEGRQRTHICFFIDNMYPLQ